MYKTVQRMKINFLLISLFMFPVEISISLEEGFFFILKGHTSKTREI